MEQNCRIGRVLNEKGTLVKKETIIHCLTLYAQLYGGKNKKRELYVKISTLKAILRFHK